MINTTTTFWLVAVSILTAMIASYAAFSFAERLAASKGRTYVLWLISGAMSMGLGIWSMHYLGMLAVDLPIEVSYHIPTVFLSLLLAVCASAAALWTVSDIRLSRWRCLQGSLLMGLGIGGMHYVGMSAMRCNAMHHYNPEIVLLSVFIAFAFSWLSLQLTFYIRARKDSREALRFGGAATMGLGIAAMHYTAMAAATFERSANSHASGLAVHVSALGVTAIASTVGMVLFGAIASSVLDRKLHHRLQNLLDQLSEENERFHAAVESSMDAFYICNAVRDDMGEIVDFVFVFLNDNFGKIVSIPRDQLLGSRMCEVLPVSRRIGSFDRYKQVVITGVPLVHEYPVEDKDVISGWVRIQAVKVRDGVAVTASDITDRKKNEVNVMHMAQHDQLTGLLNRNSMRERMSHALNIATRHQNGVGILLLDLDGFKYINDTFGHKSGDRVLVVVADRLQSLVRACDSVIRLGGDEFLVVLSAIHQVSDLERCSEKILRSIEDPIQIEDRKFKVTCSIGGTFCNGSNADLDELLATADAAMYSAKKQGKNGVRLCLGGFERQLSIPGAVSCTLAGTEVSH